MVAWVALIVSIISLTVNIIVQRDKLTAFFDDLSKWQQQKSEIRKARALIGRIAKADSAGLATDDKSPLIVPSVLTISFFLISVIASAIISLMEQYLANLSAIIPIGAGMFVVVSIIPIIVATIVFMKTDWRDRIYSAGTLIFAAFFFGMIWGVITYVVSLFHTPLLYAGITAGVLESLYLWIEMWREENKVSGK